MRFAINVAITGAVITMARSVTNATIRLRGRSATYGDNFASEYRSDAKLRTVLKGENADTLSELLKRR